MQDDDAAAAAPQTEEGSEAGGATTSMIYSNCQVPFRRPSFVPRCTSAVGRAKTRLFLSIFLSDIQSLPPQPPYFAQAGLAFEHVTDAGLTSRLGSKATIGMMWIPAVLPANT